MNILKSGGELNEEEVSEDEDAENSSKNSSKQKKGKKQKTLSKVSKQMEIKIRQKTAHEFLNKYPAFQENTAYMLVSILFSTLTVRFLSQYVTSKTVSVVLSFF